MLQCCHDWLFKLQKEDIRYISHAIGNTFTKVHTVAAMHYGSQSSQKLLFQPPRMEKKNAILYAVTFKCSSV